PCEWTGEPGKRRSFERSMGLFRLDLPEMDARLSGLSLCLSRRSGSGDDTVDRTAAVTDDKPVLDLAVRGAERGARREGHVQMDQLGPRAIGIDRVAAGLAACKVPCAHCSKAIATIISL